MLAGNLSLDRAAVLSGNTGALFPGHGNTGLLHHRLAHFFRNRAGGKKQPISTYSLAVCMVIISSFLPTLLSWSAVACCWNLLARLSRNGSALFLGHLGALFPWHRGTLVAGHAPAAGGSNLFAHLSRHLHTILRIRLKVKICFGILGQTHCK